MIKSIKKFIKKDRIKRHLMIIAKHYPEWHSKSGQSTHFGSKISGLSDQVKIHEICTDYEDWLKVKDDVNVGKAKMTICYREIRNMEIYDTKICSLTNIRIQVGRFLSSITDGIEINNKIVPIKVLAKNQGLSEPDFLDWYKYYGNKTVGIIHFTDFEY